VKSPGFRRVFSGKTGKIQAVDLYMSRFSKILEEFLDGEEEYPEKREKSRLWTCTQQVFKDFVRIPGWGRGISRKNPSCVQVLQQPHK